MVVVVIRKWATWGKWKRKKDVAYVLRGTIPDLVE